jgi:hypothetical protein
MRCANMGETKHQLLSSILAEKLELKGEKYRTPVFKEGFDLIYQLDNQLQGQKPKYGRPHRCNLPLGPYRDSSRTLFMKMQMKSTL